MESLKIHIVALKRHVSEQMVFVWLTDLRDCLIWYGAIAMVLSKAAECISPGLLRLLDPSSINGDGVFR